ncbi:hypothetical protein C0J52_07832 [Blattella germanica]|nr:hypothetical protein C0J52_07832 [Blattella germanica]
MRSSSLTSSQINKSTVNLKGASPTHFDIRSTFHKTWMCHLSNRNKSKDSQRSTDCKAKIDIKIKKLNRNTKRKDKYLRRDPPLSAVMHVELKHNHHLQCDSVLKYLRISEEVTEQFECYFRDGLTPIEACEVHEMKIKLNGNADINLADGSLNPSLRKVYHLYHKWRRATAAGAQPIVANGNYTNNTNKDSISMAPTENQCSI